VTVYQCPLPLVFSKDVGGAQHVVDRVALSRDAEPPAFDLNRVGEVAFGDDLQVLQSDLVFCDTATREIELMPRFGTCSKSLRNAASFVKSRGPS
jgi:hypothetical protein